MLNSVFLELTPLKKGVYILVEKRMKECSDCSWNLVGFSKGLFVILL